MVISASRRTDIPAFYAKWFMNRIRAGCCAVPNPFNLSQVSYVSLRPEDVDVIVFWTRDARGLLPHLAELDQRGYRYYFQYTIMDNPRLMDLRTPRLEASLNTFRTLADHVSPERVVWRYDPIVLSNVSAPEFHQKTYQYIAKALRGHTRRSVISIVDVYSKAQKRLRQLAEHGVELLPSDGEAFTALMRALVRTAKANGMEIYSCAEDLDLERYDVRPGKCVDDKYITKTFGIAVHRKKDPSQREACGCVVSRDIGMYNSCLCGCQYCYATSSFERARINYGKHHPESPSLIGWPVAEPRMKSPQQGTLW